MNFITKNSSCIDGNLGYDDTLISNTSNLKFFWLIIDDTLTWISYIEITAPKSNAACFAVTVVELYDTWHLQNDTLFLFSFNYELWFNILVEIPHTAIAYLKYKRGLPDL
jgi:hypothetical protein